MRPRGTVRKEQTFTLTTADGKALPLQNWPLAYWPDGSMNMETKNPAFAKKAWSFAREARFATTSFKGPEVLNPIDEVPGLSTNSTAQGCLEAIEVLDMCGGQM